MSDITLWSNDESGNNAAPPDGAPENQTLISDLNNIDRETMAAVRRWYESPDYRDLGLGLEPTGPSDGIVLTGNQTAFFSAGQSIQWTDSGGTKTGRITAVNLTAPNTTLTVNGSVNHPVSQLLSGPDFSGYDTQYAIPADPATNNNVALLAADGNVKNSTAAISADLNTDANLATTAAINAGIAAAIADGAEINSFSRSSLGYIEFKVSSTTGIMLQWGTSTDNSTRTFAKSFSATPYMANASLIDSSGAASSSVTIDLLTSTSIRTNNPGSRTAYWFVVGPTSI